MFLLLILNIFNNFFYYFYNEQVNAGYFKVYLVKTISPKLTESGTEAQLAERSEGKVPAPFLKLNRPQTCNFIRKETLAQVFSCEFYEISKNTFFTKHVRTTASISPPLDFSSDKTIHFYFLIFFICNYLLFYL